MQLMDSRWLKSIFSTLKNARLDKKLREYLKVTDH